LRHGIDDADAISTVVADDHVIGLASGEGFLKARAEGLPIVAFASSYVLSSMEFFTLPGTRLLEPADLQGKRIGYKPGPETDISLYALIARNAVAQSGIKIVESDQALSDLLDGRIDVLIGHRDVEGQALEITGGLTGDSPRNNSYVWIPSLKAVVAGDIVFSGVHFVVPKMHEEWLRTLAAIAALNPTIVVAGHQIAGAPTDASSIEFMKQYMQYFDQSAASSKSAEELREKMKARYPNLGLETLLNSGSQAAFPAPAK